MYKLILFIVAFVLTNNTKAQIISAPQQDSLYLSHPFKDKIQQIKKTLAQTFKNYKGNDMSLFGSLTLNHQNINDKGITAPINYLYDAVNSNTFNPGYSGGFRWDGVYKETHKYAIILSINKINAGSNYLNKYHLAPFIEDFTHFKANNKYTTISLAVNYKKLLPINDMNKYKFYAVAGPSFDYKISTISSENLINGAGNRFFINGDIGAEFDNQDYYVLFAHYKLGVHLFNSIVPIQLNRFEIGMSVKARDLF